MSDFVGFLTFPQDLLTGKHNFEMDEFRLMLSNAQPNEAVALTFPDIAEIAPQNGYAAGGQMVDVTLSLVGAESIVFGAPVVFTAAGGEFGPFRYIVMYNHTHIEQPLVGYWDYGSSISLLDTETLSITFNGVNGIFKHYFVI